jgi:adenosylcobinamide-phosphate synthase
MAHALTGILAGHPLALVLAATLDLAIGDPPYHLHPVRLIGRALAAIEGRLRAAGADGYGGGIALCVLLAVLSVGLTSVLVIALARVSEPLGWAAHGFLLYSLLALGDLVHHVRRVDRAATADDLTGARAAVSMLVGRDTDRMDAAACRRAAVESLSESLTDGFTSAVLWYAVAGLPGLVLFKVVSTMDSMVGFKTPRYLKFGWCGARLDDVMNYVPARVTWLLVTVAALVAPGYSGSKAFRIGLSQHAILPGPNSGWSEAATAGGINRRIVGPIWMNGVLVTEAWIGDPGDPPVATHHDVMRAVVLVCLAGGLAVMAAAVALS